ncbi:hypothetical protein MMC19_004976 [Ptychographa xylographoides]|nr:hypothetical protein [Ptychographa xylographoides]
MSDQVVDLVAILTPAPGKKDRVEELMLDLTKQVYKNEPDVLRYRLNYQEDTGEFVVIERYSSKDSHENHVKQPGFQNLVKCVKEENLLSKPLELKILKPIGGHDSR